MNVPLALMTVIKVYRTVLIILAISVACVKLATLAVEEMVHVKVSTDLIDVSVVYSECSILQTLMNVLLVLTPVIQILCVQILMEVSVASVTLVSLVMVHLVVSRSNYLFIGLYY